MEMEIRFGILSVSDRASRGEYEDRGGPAVEAELNAPQWAVIRREIVSDDTEAIERSIRAWADDDQLDVIFTTGGTGLGPRDVTPEATLAACTRMVPGIAETIRSESLRQTPNAMLSRGVAGVRSRTLIVNLPGSPRGAAEAVTIVRPIIEHAVATLRGAGHE